MITQIFTWTSVVFAMIAAIVWAASARVNLPLIDGTYKTADKLGPFYDATKRAAFLNMWAARSAALSALCQAISLVFAK